MEITLVLSFTTSVNLSISHSHFSFLIKEKIVSQIKFNIETFKENELPDKLKKIAALKPGSRNLSNDQN